MRSRDKQGGGDEGDACGERPPGAVSAEQRTLPEPVIATTISNLLDLRGEEDVRPLPAALLLPFDASGKTPAAVPFAFIDYLFGARRLAGTRGASG